MSVDLAAVALAAVELASVDLAATSTGPAPVARPRTVAAPVITGWSAVSPLGYGRAAFSEGIRSGRLTRAEIDPDRWRVPDRQACLVPDLEAGAGTGRRSRGLDRASMLALAAIDELATGPGVVTAPDRAAIVLGTTAGSQQTVMTIARDSLANARPFDVDPKSLSSGTMNGAAAMCAIRYGVRGPNTSLAGGRGAVVHTLAYGGRLLAAGRADTVLAGAVEEYSAARSWLAHAGRLRSGAPDIGDVPPGAGPPGAGSLGAGPPGAGPLGEGGVVLRLEPTGGARPTLARVLATDGRLCPGGPDRQADALRAGVSRLLARAGRQADEVWAVVSPTGSAVEARVARELFGPAAGERFAGIAALAGPGALAGVLGDTGAVSAGFALAAVLASVETMPEADGRLVLITTHDPEGTLASMLVRVRGGLAG
jgi:3-oxoacyl-[acyl-carrier-protein] synthase II